MRETWPDEWVTQQGGCGRDMVSLAQNVKSIKIVLIVSATSFVSVCVREGEDKTVYQNNRHRCLFSKLEAAI